MNYSFIYRVRNPSIMASPPGRYSYLQAQKCLPLTAPSLKRELLTSYNRRPSTKLLLSKPFIVPFLLGTGARRLSICCFRRPAFKNVPHRHLRPKIFLYTKPVYATCQVIPPILRQQSSTNNRIGAPSHGAHDCNSSNKQHGRSKPLMNSIAATYACYV